MKTIEEIKQLLLGPIDYRIKYSIIEGSKVIFSENEGIILREESEEEAIKSIHRLFNERSGKFRLIIKSIKAEY